MKALDSILMKDVNTQRKKLIAVLLIGLAIGYGVGTMYGTYKALDWAVDKAVYFLNLKGIEIDIASDAIAHALWAYRTQVDVCYSPNQSLTT